MNLTRTARRQLLLDRWTEILRELGDPHADDHAQRFLAPMDDLGFDLPATLHDAPPARPAHIATDTQRRAHLAHIGSTLAARRDTPNAH